MNSIYWVLFYDEKSRLYYSCIDGKVVSFRIIENKGPLNVNGYKTK